MKPLHQDTLNELVHQSILSEQHLSSHSHFKGTYYGTE